MTEDSRLLQQMNRRNLMILAALTVFSLFLAPYRFTAGVFSGGLLVLGAFAWQQRNIRLFSHEPTRAMGRKVLFGFFLRLLVIGLLLVVLLRYVRVDPIGLATGLSIVVINLFWTTGSRLLSTNDKEL